MAFLAFDSFSFFRGKHRLLLPSSFALPSVGLFSLQGPNGAGKSSFFAALSGRLPFEGRIILDGATYQKTNASGLRTKVANTGVNSPLIPYLSVEDNLRFPYQNAPDAHLEEVLNEIGLGSKRKERASHLSEGERRRLLLGIEIYGRKKILLVDEPFASLDPENAHRILTLLKDYATGALVLVSSNEALAELDVVSSGKLRLIDGRILGTDVPQESTDKVAQEPLQGANPWRAFWGLFRGRSLAMLSLLLLPLAALGVYSSYALVSAGDIVSGEEAFELASAKEGPVNYVSFQPRSSLPPAYDLKENPDFFSLAIGNTGVAIGDLKDYSADLVSSLSNHIRTLAFLPKDYLDKLTLIDGRQPTDDGDFLIPSFQWDYLLQKGYYSSYSDLYARAFTVTSILPNQPYRVVGIYESPKEKILAFQQKIFSREGTGPWDSQAFFALNGGSLGLLTPLAKDANPYGGEGYVFVDHLTLSQIRGYILFAWTAKDAEDPVPFAFGRLGEEEQTVAKTYWLWWLIASALSAWVSLALFFFFVRPGFLSLDAHASPRQRSLSAFAVFYFLLFGFLPFGLAVPAGLIGAYYASAKVINASFILAASVNLFRYNLPYLLLMSCALGVAFIPCLLFPVLLGRSARRGRP